MPLEPDGWDMVASPLGSSKEYVWWAVLVGGRDGADDALQQLELCLVVGKVEKLNTLRA